MFSSLKIVYYFTNYGFVFSRYDSLCVFLFPHFYINFQTFSSEFLSSWVLRVDSSNWADWAKRRFGSGWFGSSGIPVLFSKTLNSTVPDRLWVQMKPTQSDQCLPMVLVIKSYTTQNGDQRLWELWKKYNEWVWAISKKLEMSYILCPNIVTCSIKTIATITALTLESIQVRDDLM